jgi:hypothetical protein
MRVVPGLENAATLSYSHSKIAILDFYLTCHITQKWYSWSFMVVMVTRQNYLVQDNCVSYPQIYVVISFYDKSIESAQCGREIPFTIKIKYLMLILSTYLGSRKVVLSRKMVSLQHS